jgi:hypothetical protein
MTKAARAMRVCAWCGSRMGLLAGAGRSGDGAASHGICRRCAARLGDALAGAEASSTEADREGASSDATDALLPSRLPER